MKEKDLALVTGASSGIGAAFARRIARDGYNLILVARRRERLEELARELFAKHQTKTEICEADLSALDGIEGVKQKIQDSPPLAMLVNGAGFGTRGLFANIEASRTLAMNHVHVLAPVMLTRAALPKMIEARRGRIICISSLSAFFTTARYVSYSATKAYLNMFCEGLQAELEGTGVQVQAICPGLTRTEFFDSPEYSSFKYSQVPNFAWMTPEEVVDEALASDQVIFVPGRHYRVFVGLMKTPVVGKLLGWTLAKFNQAGDGLF